MFLLHSVADFQTLAVTSEHHYETVPQKESVVPSSTTLSHAHEENNHQPPPGSIPTPVVIASKISEHQGNGGITSSTLLGRKSSLESKRDRSMPARTPNLPSKISMTRGNQEPTPHSLATAAVSIQERRSQMLANLPAGSHPLEGGEPACMRNMPIRSVSFKDMEPEKSRMEALSKLGLMGGKTSNSTASIVSKGSSGTTSPNISDYKVSSGAGSPISNSNKVSRSASSASSIAYNVSSSAKSPISSTNKVSGDANSPINSTNKVSSANSPNSSTNKVSSNANSPISSPNKVSSNANSASNSANNVSISTHAHMSNNNNTSSNINQKKSSNTFVTQSSSSRGYEPKLKNEISSNSFNYYGGKSAAIMPITKETNDTVNQERRSSIPPAGTEVKQTDFNSYGGKSIVLNPTMNAKADSIPSPSANTPETETLFNSYGGRSRIIHPSVNTGTADEVNCLQSHTTAVTATTHGDSTRFRSLSEQQTYDAKPKALTSKASDPVNQPIVRTRPATLPPPTAPRPLYHTGSLKPRPDPVPQEILAKPAPSFRNQGVTVQFSGKGTTGEARRDALRRLGLLKNTS